MRSKGGWAGSRKFQDGKEAGPRAARAPAPVSRTRRALCESGVVSQKVIGVARREGERWLP